MNAIPSWLVWLVANVVWLGFIYCGYIALRRISPRFASAHSPETGAAIVVLLGALFYAVLSAYM